MIAATYLSSLGRGFADGWTRFWFTPRDPLPLGIVRIGIGLVTLYVVASYGFDLERWFGEYGTLPVATVDAFRAMTAADDPVQHSSAHFSYFDYTTDRTTLWVLHGASVAVVAAFTLGLFTRVTSVLTLVALLAYFHRAPQITGQVEPVLSLFLLGLCLGPCGDALSIDAWRRRRTAAKTPAAAPIAIESWNATLSTRFMQVHLSIVYMMMFLAKQMVALVWWQGTAVWWLIARPDTALIDLRSLHNSLYLINLWTCAIILFELSFAILIWVRAARPLLIGISAVMWIGLALLTGNVPFCAAMFTAGLIFIDAEQWRALGIGRKAAT